MGERCAARCFVPHPNPLPEGEGIAAAWGTSRVHGSPFLRVKEHSAQLLPLPTGEGWGEGRAYRPEGSSPFSCSQVMACSRSWTVW